MQGVVPHAIRSPTVHTSTMGSFGSVHRTSSVLSLTKLAGEQSATPHFSCCGSVQTCTSGGSVKVRAVAVFVLVAEKVNTASVVGLLVVTVTSDVVVVAVVDSFPTTVTSIGIAPRTQLLEVEVLGFATTLNSHRAVTLATNSDVVVTRPDSDTLKGSSTLPEPRNVYFIVPLTAAAGT